MQVVRELNMTDYDALAEEEDAWLVAFYAGKEAESLFRQLLYPSPMLSATRLCQSADGFCSHAVCHVDLQTHCKLGYV